MFGIGLQQIISFVKECGVFFAFGMAVMWTIWTQLISINVSKPPLY